MWLKRVFIVMTGLLLLIGCSNKGKTVLKPEEVLAEVEKAHEDVTFLHITEELTDAVDAAFNYEAIGLIDFAEEKSLYELVGEEVYLYKNKDEHLIMIEGERLDPQDINSEVQSFRMSYEMEYQQNPLKKLLEFDNHLFQSFTMKENRESYIFSYNGDMDSKVSLVQGIIWSSHLQANQLVDSYKDLELTDVELEITATINKKTSLLELVKIRIKYTPPAEFNGIALENTVVYKYEKYNEAVDIERPELIETEKTATAEGLAISEEQIKQYEKEAGEYVDALIQATVFQNVDEYVDRVPGSQTEEVKKDDGSIQQSMFRYIYEQNTMDNMGDFGVTEEQVSEFASAFLQALSQTSYEITDAELQSADMVRVQVSIIGIDDTMMNYKVGEALLSELDSGELEVANVLDRNLELMMEAYRESVQFLDPSDAFVDVMIDADGTYKVLLQDQYLLKFVQ